MIRPKKDKNRIQLVRTKIYFIKNKRGNRVKIGLARDIQLRLSMLQTDNYEELILIGYVWGGRNLEKELHKKFKKYNVKGEWFKLNKFIQKEIDILLGNEIEKKEKRRCKICNYLLSESNPKDICRHHEYKGW